MPGFSEEEWREFDTLRASVTRRVRSRAQGPRRRTDTVRPRGPGDHLAPGRQEPDLRGDRRAAEGAHEVAGAGPSFPPMKAIGDEDPLLGIPTTYYAAVQLEGTASRHFRSGRRCGGPASSARSDPTLHIADPLSAHEAQLRDDPVASASRSTRSGRSPSTGATSMSPTARRYIAGLEQRGSPGDLAAARQTRRRIDASG